MELLGLIAFLTLIAPLAIALWSTRRKHDPETRSAVPAWAVETMEWEIEKELRP